MNAPTAPDTGGEADGYRNFPGHSMCCRCDSCENANRNRSSWFPGDTPAPRKAEGDLREKVLMRTGVVDARSGEIRYSSGEELVDYKKAVRDWNQLREKVSAAIKAAPVADMGVTYHAEDAYQPARFEAFGAAAELAFLLFRERGAILAALSATQQPVSEQGERFVTGPVWKEPDLTDEDGGPIWTSEVQGVGGWSVVATVHGEDEAEASRRAEAICRMLNALPPAPDAIEAEQGGKEHG